MHCLVQVESQVAKALIRRGIEDSSSQVEFGSVRLSLL